MQPYFMLPAIAGNGPRTVSTMPGALMRGLWPKAGGRHSGGCRAPGANKGSYDERWNLSIFECQRECVAQGARCLGFEYALIKRSARCELHHDPITHVFPIPGFECHIRPLSMRSYR